MCTQTEITSELVITSLIALNNALFKSEAIMEFKVGMEMSSCICAVTLQIPKTYVS